MSIELTQENEEALQDLFQKFMQENNISSPTETDFIIDSYYCDVLLSIELYLDYLKKYETDKIAEEI